MSSSKEIEMLRAEFADLKQFVQQDAIERKKQYRVLLALIPKAREDVQVLIEEAHDEIEAGVLMMLVNFRDKIEELAAISEQNLYTATEIGKMIGMAPTLVGKVAKALGYRGNPNYSVVSMYRRNGSIFPKEQVMYKEIALPGFKKAAEFLAA